MIRRREKNPRHRVFLASISITHNLERPQVLTKPSSERDGQNLITPKFVAVLNRY